MLSVATFEMAIKGNTLKINLQCVLPCSHVKRDGAFEATYEKLFAAERRSDEERSLNPDLVDTPLYARRSYVLETGRTLHRLTLDGVSISVGDAVIFVLSSPLPPRQATVTSAFFASQRSGLSQCSEVHAGDLVVTCKGDGNDEMNGSLIARHWMASVLSPLSWTAESSSDVFHDVRELQVRAARDAVGSGNLLPPLRPKSSTLWRLKNGVRDAVPFSINSDDRGTTGKERVAGRGVYGLYIHAVQISLQQQLVPH